MQLLIDDLLIWGFFLNFNHVKLPLLIALDSWHSIKNVQVAQKENNMVNGFDFFSYNSVGVYRHMHLMLFSIIEQLYIYVHALAHCHCHIAPRSLTFVFLIV